MSADLQNFIAHSLQSITLALRTSVGVPVETVSTTQTKDGALKFLDISVAESLTNGSLIFPNTVDETHTDWCILALSVADRSNGEQIYHLRGRLQSGGSAEIFAERAYELILMRTIDETGQQIYPHLLRTHELTRRDVLRALADSDEAKGVGIKLIIIPEPSSWLSALGVIPREDAKFPGVIVLV